MFVIKLIVTALSLVWLQAEDSSAEKVLTVSQFILAGAGSGQLAVSAARNVDYYGQAPGLHGAASVAVAILAERALQKKWSGKTKYIVAGVNFAVAAVLAGYLRANAGQIREDIRKVRGMP